MKTKKHGLIVMLPNGTTATPDETPNPVREIAIGIGITLFVIVFAILFFSC
jgi:hypothetical protein